LGVVRGEFGVKISLAALHLRQLADHSPAGGFAVTNPPTTPHSPLPIQHTLIPLTQQYYRLE